MAEEQKFVSIVSLDLPCMDFITALGFGGNCTFNEFRYLPSTWLEITVSPGFDSMHLRGI